MGTVDAPQFRFVELRGMRSPLIPFCYGSVSHAPSGSVIRGRIRLPIGTSLLAAISIAFMLAFVPLDAFGGYLEMWFGIMFLAILASLVVLSGIVSRRQQPRYLGFLESVLSAKAVDQ